MPKPTYLLKIKSGDAVELIAKFGVCAICTDNQVHVVSLLNRPVRWVTRRQCEPFVQDHGFNSSGGPHSLNAA